MFRLLTFNVTVNIVMFKAVILLLVFSLYHLFLFLPSSRLSSFYDSILPSVLAY